jgi:hypothetical protein
MMEKVEEGNEKRYIVGTKQGTIDQEAVAKYRQAHIETLIEQNPNMGRGGELLETQAVVNCVSSNQT